ncbi:MAG: POTRA domain-containing protein, partial [Pseudohongiellaceae bacterium]
MIKIRLFLFFVLLCPAIAFAQSFTIEDLRVEGLQRVSAGSVFAAVPVRVGDQADQVVIQDTIRSLFQTGFFNDIAVYRDANVLVIEVSERPAIAEINLEGNSVLKDEDLLDSLRDQGLSEGQIFRPATLDALGKELSRVYVSQGHYGAEIETEVRELPRNRVAIDINIGEGEQA